MIKAQSKYEQIYDFIIKTMEKSEIGELLPCETVLAEKLAVNRMTVSKVMSTLKSQGYVARKQGQGSTILKKPVKEVKGIISVLPGPDASIKDEYFSTLMHTVSRQSISNGYINTFTGCPEPGFRASFDYDTLNSLAGSGRYSGAIVIDTKMHNLAEWKEKFQYPSFPVVWIAMNHRYNPEINCVDTDNYNASIKVVEYLHSKGHRKIGFISSMIDTAHRRERFAGFQEGLKRFGLESKDEWMLRIEDMESTLHSGYRAAKILSEMKELPESFFIAEYHIMTGLKNFEKENNVSILSRIPSVMFGYEFTGEFENVIASVRQPFEGMGKEAFDLLMKISSGQEKTPVMKILNTEIITAEILRSEKKAI